MRFGRTIYLLMKLLPNSKSIYSGTSHSVSCVTFSFDNLIFLSLMPLVASILEHAIDIHKNIKHIVVSFCDRKCKFYSLMHVYSLSCVTCVEYKLYSTNIVASVGLHSIASMYRDQQQEPLCTFIFRCSLCASCQAFSE